MRELPRNQSRSELRDLVVDAALLQFHPAISDAAFGQSPLGLLMLDVMGDLWRGFEVHGPSIASVPRRNATQKSCDEWRA